MGVGMRHWEALDPALVEKLADAGKLQRLLRQAAIFTLESEQALIKKGMPREQAREVAYSQWLTPPPETFGLGLIQELAKAGSLDDVKASNATRANIVQQNPPREKRDAFEKLAVTLMDEGIDTPEKMAALLDKLIGKKSRPYSQSLWFNIKSQDVSNTSPDRPDWNEVYGAMDEPAKKETPASVTENPILKRMLIACAKHWQQSGPPQSINQEIDRLLEPWFLTVPKIPLESERPIQEYLTPLEVLVEKFNLPESEIRKYQQVEKEPESDQAELGELAASIIQSYYSSPEDWPVQESKNETFSGVDFKTPTRR